MNKIEILNSIVKVNNLKNIFPNFIRGDNYQ